MTPNLQKKVDRALRLIHAAGKSAKEHGQPLEISYSGGKDSDVILELARMAGINYRAIYKNTTIDPPGTIKHVQEMGVEMVRPKLSFRQVLEKKGLPSRYMRFCCSELKDYKILDRQILGIRRVESHAREERYKEPEVCRKYSATEEVRQYLPILDWSLSDVVEFLKLRNIKCAPVYYDEYGNFHPEKRLGCMCCPLGSRAHRIDEFKKYPNMVKLYIKAAQEFLNAHPKSRRHEYYRDAAEWFVSSLYCDNLRDYRAKFGKENLFCEGVDCRKYVESVFGINL